MNVNRIPNKDMRKRKLDLEVIARATKGKLVTATNVDNKSSIKAAIPQSNPVHPMDLKIFKDTGLLLIVNQLLHVFGWAIVLDQEDDGTFSRMYPARTSFRGFAQKNVELSYKQVSKYMRENADALEKEANEE